LLQASLTDRDAIAEKERSVTTTNFRVTRPDGNARTGRWAKQNNSTARRSTSDNTSRPVGRPSSVEHAVARLRDLATAGELAGVAAAGGPERSALVGAAYAVVWPIVFARLTRRFEQQRGHTTCTRGVGYLLDECLDRFHDDVEAVVDDLLTHARKPIVQLEAWVSARLGTATVNAYRRRRATRGALQRPRLPGWLADELGHSKWLGTLATNILVWVGVSTTAGGELWPLEVWAQERGACTGDWPGSDPATVEREVAQVLVAMRKRPEWYENFVERPLGAKEPPVAAAVTDAYGEPVAPLCLADPDQEVDEELHRLAQDAVRVIGDRLRRGEGPEPVVAEVIRTVFGGAFIGALDRAPHSQCDPVGGLSGALVDRDRLAMITETALAIIGEREVSSR
jgi:hypothetical protein